MPLHPIKPTFIRSLAPTRFRIEANSYIGKRKEALVPAIAKVLFLIKLRRLLCILDNLEVMNIAILVQREYFEHDLCHSNFSFIS